VVVDRRPTRAEIHAPDRPPTGRGAKTTLVRPAHRQNLRPDSGTIPFRRPATSPHLPTHARVRPFGLARSFQITFGAARVQRPSTTWRWPFQGPLPATPSAFLADARRDETFAWAGATGPRRSGDSPSAAEHAGRRRSATASKRQLERSPWRWPAIRAACLLPTKPIGRHGGLRNRNAWIGFLHGLKGIAAPCC